MSGPERNIGVAFLGYGFMGRVHSRALRAVSELDIPLTPQLISLSGRDVVAAGAVGARYGWPEVTADWRAQVADPRVGLFGIGGPNHLHAEVAIAAAHAGKHVLCEKPLGLDGPQSQAMWQAAEAAGVIAACGFNYRFVPAVRRAYDLIQTGLLGDIVHVRARYLQSHGWEAPTAAWRFDPLQAGTGALGDLGAHVIDLVRHLAGEIVGVSSLVRSFVPGHRVDDAFVSTIELDGGAIGTIEATRLARGHLNQHTFEINGSRGSVAFDLEHFDRLLVSAGGPYRSEQVTGDWWPAGHTLGWADTFTLQLAHVLRAIAGEGALAPLAASFEDGYRAAAVCDAILRSARSGASEPVSPPTP